MELRQKLESKETKATEPQIQDESKQYVTTDKQEYTLGDIVVISGSFEISEPKKTLDGKLKIHQGFWISIINADNNTVSYGDVVVCTMTNNSVAVEQFPDIETDKFYDRDSSKGIAKECNVDKNGKFSFDFEIDGDYFSGIHRAEIRMGFGNGWEITEYSQPFTIK